MYRLFHHTASDWTDRSQSKIMELWLYRHFGGSDSGRNVDNIQFNLTLSYFTFQSVFLRSTIIIINRHHFLFRSILQTQRFYSVTVCSSLSLSLCWCTAARRPTAFRVCRKTRSDVSIASRRKAFNTQSASDGQARETLHHVPHWRSDRPICISSASMQ